MDADFRGFRSFVPFTFSNPSTVDTASICALSRMPRSLRTLIGSLNRAVEPIRKVCLICPAMALSAEETKRVWEGLYTSKVHSLYFASLSSKYQKQQAFMTWCSLFLSCGAAGTFVSSLKESHPWVPTLLALLTAALSAYAVVARKERKGVDSSSLSMKYEQLRLKYDLLFRNLPAATPNELIALEEKRVELSQPAHSLANKPRLMVKSQDQIAKLEGLR